MKALFIKKAKRNWFNYDGNRMISYVDVDGSMQKQRFKVFQKKKNILIKSFIKL